MQRVVGYCLTGDIREEQMWIFWGSGGNGKSEFCAPWRKVLGKDLAQMATFAAFCYNPNSDQHPTDLAAMDRARLVVASEKHRQKPLDESVIKNLTGGESIRARFMRQDFFEFEPQFKLWFCVNDLPEINADAAIRRRVRMVPFLREFTGKDQDVDLGKKLLAEAEGILVWAVRGCLLWQREGLGSCAAVERTTDNYMRQMNLLSARVETCCELNPGAMTPAGALQANYHDWCEDRGSYRLRDEDYAKP
jgi:putative DNA primase/helicase